MTITSTTTSFPTLKRGDFINKNDIRKNEEAVYLDPTVTTPNFYYAIPVILTGQTVKFVNGKRIVIKALANSALADIIGFTKIADRDPELFFIPGNALTLFKGNEAYNQFGALLKVGVTVVAGDLLEFVPADNTYAPVTTGTGVVRALQAGVGGDIIAVQPLI